MLTGSIDVVSKTSSTIAARSPVGTDDVGVVGYRWSRDGGAVWVNAGRDYTFTGLTAATAYALRVQALDAANNASEPALALSVTTEAAPVTTLYARVPLTVETGMNASTLTGISWAFWNTATPVIGSAADFKGTGAAVDGQGKLNLALPGTTLAAGGVGFLQLVINGGSPDSAVNRAMSKPFAVSL